MWEVRLHKDEWDKLQEELEDYHETVIDNIRQVTKGIGNMLRSKDYFSVGETNTNLILLVETMEENILPLIENVFGDTEQSVHTFIVGNNNIDTIL